MKHGGGGGPHQHLSVWTEIFFSPQISLMSNISTTFQVTLSLSKSIFMTIMNYRHGLSRLVWVYNILTEKRPRKKKKKTHSRLVWAISEAANISVPATLRGLSVRHDRLVMWSGWSAVRSIISWARLGWGSVNGKGNGRKGCPLSHCSQEVFSNSVWGQTSSPGGLAPSWGTIKKAETDRHSHKTTVFLPNISHWMDFVWFPKRPACPPILWKECVSFPLQYTASRIILSKLTPHGHSPWTALNSLHHLKRGTLLKPKHRWEARLVKSSSSDSGRAFDGCEVFVSNGLLACVTQCCLGTGHNSTFKHCAHAPDGANAWRNITQLFLDHSNAKWFQMDQIKLPDSNIFK